MSQVSHDRRKRKAQYKRAHYGYKRPRFDTTKGGPTQLNPGMRGFIITCNKKERESGYEALHLLEDALKRITSDDEISSSDNEDDEDIEKAMREEADKEKKERKFRPVTTGVSNCIFIVSSAANRCPTALVNEVFGELITSRRSQPRFALRMLPVEAVCRVDDLLGVQQACSQLWADFIDHRRIKRPERPTFAVDFKSRNFSMKPNEAGGTLLTKDAAVAAWVDAVKARSPEYSVDMVSPSVLLATNVLRKCVCLSLLEFKDEFAKYNLREVLSATRKQEAEEKEKGKDEREEGNEKEEGEGKGKGEEEGKGKGEEEGKEGSN